MDAQSEKLQTSDLGGALQLLVLLQKPHSLNG